MFASIRRYRIARGSMGELARRVDDGFAEEISTRPGFLSYELIDCDDGEVITISSFAEAHQAEASRELAHRWTEENLADLELCRIEALHGEVMVSRATAEILEPTHTQMSGRFASLRRYTLRSGDADELLRTVDRVFTEQISGIDGFEAYHALDCGRGEVMTISLFRDQSGCEESDERALRFVDWHLRVFDLERSEVIGGEVRVSRALSKLLEPAHA